MNIKRTALLTTFACLTLSACRTDSVPIEQLAEELKANQDTAIPTPTPAPTPAASRAPAPTPAPLPSASLDDPTGDCLAAPLTPIDCSLLQRDVTGVSLVSDGRTLTITVTIEGEPWGQFPDHFAVFQFDTDMDSATGSRTLGIQHGMGTDTNIYWGWTPGTLPFGGEHYDEVGTLTEMFGERDELVTVVDDQTLQLEVAIEDIGSDTFNFVFSLEAPPGVNIFDYAPEPGESLIIPAGG